jgi:LPPG:FO 2-phospho-L-lactate transferase
VALAGGTGAAKLLRGLARVSDPSRLTVVVNTGDDAVVWGLHVSPDLDSICYALGDLLDRDRGWGLRGDSFHARDAMARFGEPTWFSLGDQDLATHLHRTALLGRGQSLTEVTARVATALGVTPRVLPMSDDPVRTRLLGPDGWLDFQEYFVRERARTPVRAVRYEGAAEATPAPGVLDAIRDADAIVVCPSNPVTSIAPILAVPGLADGLGRTPAPAIAVSPIVGGAAVSGPAGALMAATGLPVSPAGVARAYAPWLDALIVDETDADLRAAVEAEGARCVSAPIIMKGPEDEVALARAVLEALG